MMGRTSTAPKRGIAELPRALTVVITSPGPLRNRLLAAAVTLLVVIGLSWPMITTKSGMNQDWPNHLWFLWQQGLTIKRDGVPSLFLTMGSIVFYPLYAFYGGTLYTLGGLLSLALGDAPVKAYVLMYMAGFAWAMGGFYWIARMAGVGRWLAHAPGVIFVTSAYLLTDVYARGAWPEFMAICSIPLLAAAALSILRDNRLRPGSTFALALATVVLFGSHNITTLWGVTFLLLTTLTLLIFVPPSRRLLTRAGLLRLGAVMTPAVMVNSWFLLPALAYGTRTAIGHTPTGGLLRATSILVNTHHLFTFSRASAVHHIHGLDDAPDFALSLPILAIAWVGVGAVLATKSRRGAAMVRVAWIFIAWGVVFGVVMTHVGLIEALPHPYTFVQFQYRLSSYVLLALGGAMIAVLALHSRTRHGAGMPGSPPPDRLHGPGRALLLALVPVLAVAAAGAAVQVAAYPTAFPDRNVDFLPTNQPPASFFARDDYYDHSLPQVATSSPLPMFAFPPASIHHDRVELTYASASQPTVVTTNLVAAPYLVGVHGASVAGRLGGAIVLRLPPPHPGSGVVTLSPSRRLPVVLGSVLSVLGLIGVLASLAWSVAISVRARRRSASLTATTSETASTRAHSAGADRPRR
jgi:hypothetical protein